MDLETACRDLREPGVIDEKVLYSAIIEQGPKGEEGRLFKLQGIVYEEITNLRLEFLNILKIDHLWMMTGLTKLQLSNNAIEKIENLDVLVNLKELDLSFNNIEKIENLTSLTELEVLTLYQNKIEVLENLKHLSQLTVFSVGNNRIASYDSVIYLRTFASLKCFNMAGNPICEEENFNKFAIAYLPQLVYYEYKMVSTAEKLEAREFFLRDLVKLEREEEELKLIESAKKLEEKEERLNAEAFVEYLGGDQLFMSLFEKDADCKTLLQMGENILEIYNEFKRNFTEVTKELHTFGLQQLQLRKAEMAEFEKHIGNAKEKVIKESREVVEDFLQQKNILFSQVKDFLNAEMEDEDRGDEDASNIQMINDTFRDLCYKTWNALMKRELYLFESTEEVNGIYERALTELVNQFIEGAQAQFTQLRQLQGSFNEGLTDAANKLFTNYTVGMSTGPPDKFKSIPKDLIQMLQDKEGLTNALSASHDYHLLVIDQREDKLVSGIKNWLSNIVGNLVDSEIERNRTSIMEINHFLDMQKAELHELLSSPGLLLLPKDLQDALQM